MDKTRLASQLRVSEGVVDHAYRDSLGYWTGGVGHLLDQTKDWTGISFSCEQIDAWLAEDIDKAVDEADGLPEWQHLDTDARQNALVELVFNMGLSHWRQFAKCRYALCKRDWQDAHNELIDSLWAKQVGPTRSNRIANQLLTGAFA